MKVTLLKQLIGKPAAVATGFCLILALTAPLQAGFGQAGTAYILPPGAAPAMDPHSISERIASQSPKTVVFVFDVTGSTRTGGVFEREREATATILRRGCKVGDHVVLIKFGTGVATVFDTVLSESVSASSLIDQIPPSTEPGAGTNIRWPHHEALRIIDGDAPNPGVVVLLTDSFNDQPVKSDPNYSKYRAYYNLYSLTVYPSSSENRDYVRLLSKLRRERRLREYGVGVAIARSGRPVERLPLASGEGTDSLDNGSSQTTVLLPTGHETVHTNWDEISISAVTTMLFLIAGLAMLSGRPTSVRLSVGGKAVPSDFRIKPGARLGLGGTPATAPPGAEIYLVSGLNDTAGWILGERGGVISLSAASGSSSRLLHNGIGIQEKAPLRVDDEIRIIVPATDTSEEKQFRIRLLDPKAPH